MATPQTLKEAQESLHRMQAFDAKTLARVEDLGREMNFTIAVDPAERLIELCMRISLAGQ